MQSYARIRIHFNTRDIFLSRKLLIVLGKMSVGKAEHSKSPKQNFRNFLVNHARLSNSGDGYS